MNSTKRVVIVGAGLAGLSAARLLKHHYEVVVLDKGRGVGGRMATRRIGAATFDHGAQFFTTHTAEFAAIVAEWETAAVAAPWFKGRIGPAGIVAADGHTRYRGVASMNAVAKHLARDLDVRCATPVVALAATTTGWNVILENGVLESDAVVMTAPVPQALSLFDAGEVSLTADDREALISIRYEPCLALLAALRGPSGLTMPGAVSPDVEPIGWMADNQMKHVSNVAAVTIHATPAFSADHWSSAPAEIAEELLRAAALDAQPVYGMEQVQRWRYARPTIIHPQRCLVANGLPPLVCSGDAFGGAKVEGAVLSGVAAANAIKQLLGSG